MEAVGERLRIDAPRGTVTRELRAALTERKGEILALLTGPLDAWLAEPVPLRCDPPGGLAELETLAGRLEAYLGRGLDAHEAAPPDHPRRREVDERWRERHAAHVALCDLLNALGERAYDRHRLGTWTAGQLFLAGDMPAVLAVVDAGRGADGRWGGSV